MNEELLRTELLTDPLGRGYVGMSNQQAAADLNTKYRSRDRMIIPAHEVIEATVATEWAALSAQEKQRYALLTGAGEINAKGTNTRSAFLAMFGAGSQTRANLAALQTETISRAEELGFGEVKNGHVQTARS